jgi:hypothetical protein
VIGQSHCAAIGQAVADDCPGAGMVSIYRLADRKRPFERNAISLDDAVSIVEGLSAGTQLFLSVLGTYHNILGLLRSGPDFDFLLDERDAPYEPAQWRVPHRALASAFEQTFVEAKPVRKIRAAARVPIYLLSSPPPKQSNAFILERLLRQKKQSYRGRTIRDVGVERALSRLKLWKLESRLMASWAEGQGISFVPAPAEAFDSDGFLREELYSDDATHANARYGALVVKQICGILEVSGREPVHG